MRSIIFIARKEFQELLRDGRFQWATVIGGILLLFSLLSGYKQYSDVSSLHQQAQATSREEWLNQGQKYPHSAAHYGSFAFKPKRLLSLLDNGLEKYMGVSIWIEAHKQNEAKSRYADSATALLRFGELTGSFILQFLLPLLIIIFGYSSISGEQERGTLRLLLSQGISPAQLFSGKSLGLLFVLLTIFVPMILVSLVFFSLATGYESLSYAGSFIFLYFSAYLIYYLVFIFFTIGISSLSKVSSQSLVSLVLVWIFFCVVVPRVSVSVSEHLYPTPSAFELTSKIEYELLNGPDGHNPADRRFEAVEKELMKKYKVENAEDLPINMQGISLQISEEHGDTVFDENYGQLYHLYDSQNNVHKVSSLFSPMLNIKFLSMGLSGTDQEEQKNFADSVEQYRRKEIKMINDDISYNSTNKMGRNYLQGENLWSKVPAFSYTPLSLSQIMYNHKTDAMSLLFWLFFTATLCFLLVKRIKI